MAHKLSDLIMQGAKLRAQHKNGYFILTKGAIASCAMGAAVEALGYQPEAFLADDSLDTFFRESLLIRNMLSEAIGYSIRSAAPTTLLAAYPDMPEDWRSVHTVCVYLNRKFRHETTARILADYGL